MSELFFRIKNGDKQALQDAVEQNSGLVIKAAEYYARRNKYIDMQDLIQEGYLGLVMALHRFEPERGFKLSTYANYYIRGKMQKYVRKVHTRGASGAGHQTMDEYMNGSRDGDRLKAYKNRCVDVFYIRDENEVSNGSYTSGSVVSSTISDNTQDIDEELIVEHEWAEACDLIFNSNLTDRELICIAMRYGVFGYDTHTLPEISEAIGLSKQVVHRSLKEGISKLQGAADDRQDG